jgi:hypothetical protein
VLDTVKAHPTAVVIITGHTDADGTEAYNLDLSQRRAEAVLAWLQARGVPPTRLTASGQRGVGAGGAQRHGGPQGDQPAGNRHRADAVAAG